MSDLDLVPDTPARSPEQEIVAAVSIDLHVEHASVAKRVERTLLRASVTTHSRAVDVEAMLAHDRVEIEHIPIGRVIDVVPPIRTEGDTTILPVVEEEVVITRRLILKEEVHLRRVRTTERHTETVTIREEHVAVTRTSLPDGSTNPIPMTSEATMSTETIVAIYDTEAHAHDAVAALKAAGVPENSISVHASNEMRTGTTTTTVERDREPGFWSTLFGGDSGHDQAVYDRSLQSGSTVVTVNAPDEHVERVTQILESHHPIDIDERAETYGVQQNTGHPAAVASTMTGMATSETAKMPVATGENKLQLAEERLEVGKRLVNRGGTRIRRYVVETPVEQDVTLHSEKVTLDRRPVTDGRAVGDSFTDRSIEMTETAEVPVVQKTAHVYEEVGLHKEGSDRVETVRDSVRREEVKVEQIPAATLHPTDKI